MAVRDPEALSPHNVVKSDWARNAVAGAGLLLLATFVYRPTAPAALDYVDFPEIIRTASVGEDFSGAYRELTAVQDTMGRWSPTLIASHSAQWTLFGWNAVSWHVVRFALMSLCTLLVFLLYRRLHVNVLGSFFAASLLIVAPGATMGWTRLSTPEPIGLLFLLLAATFAESPWSWKARWGMALMFLGVIWSKEMMIASLLFPVLIAYFAVERTGGPKLKHLVTSFTPSVLILAFGVIPTLHAFLGAPPTAFATHYGSSWSAQEVAGGFLTALLPFSPAGTDGTSPLIPLLALLLLVAIGWFESIRRDPRRARQILLMALVMPLTGAVVYAPWPYYQLVYALPFLVGGALLSGQPASALFGEGGWRAAMAATCTTIILSYATMQAANDSSRIRAVQRVFASAVYRVAGTSEVDTALVAVHSSQFDPGGNFGVRFGRYARALDVQWPGIRDIRCEDIPDPVPYRHVVVIVSEMCDAPATEPKDIAIVRDRFQWPDPRARADTISVTILEAAVR